MPPVVVLDAGIAIKRLPRPTPLNASAPPEFLEDDIRYVISEQLANDCHDPNTGEFCGTGSGSASASSVIDKLPKPGPVKDLVEHALSQIDAVHGLPAGIQHIPEVYTLRSNAANLGQYTSTAVPGGTERPMKIGISHPDKVDPEYAYGSGSLAFTHEFGHYLDSVGGLAGSTEKPNTLRATLAHVTTPEWEAVYKAVLDSPTRKALKTASTFGPDKGYFAYLASPVESFARAYSQWIATRSGDSKMLADVALAKAHTNEGVKNSQWSEEEFTPIAKAFDNLFASKGLLKSLRASGVEFSNECHDPHSGEFCSDLTGDLSHLTPAHQQIVRDQIAKIPADVRKILAKKGVTIVSKATVTRSQSGKGLDYGGVYNPATHQVEVSNKGFEDLDIHTRQGDANFVLHEFGHALDYALGRVSQHPAFRALWKDAQPKTGSYFQKSFGGTNPREELLAETYAQVWQGTEPKDFKLTPSLRQIATELRHNINTGEEFAALTDPLELFNSLMEFANPYHDEAGRFTTGNGEGAATSNSSPEAIASVNYDVLTPKKFSKTLRDETLAALDNPKLVGSINEWQVGEPSKVRRDPTLLDAIHNAPASTETLYRGFREKNKGVQATANKYTEGSTIELPASSFSASYGVAKLFSDNSKAGTPVVFGTVGSQKSLPIQNFAKFSAFHSEQEHITGGKFKVIGVDKNPDIPGSLLVTLKQVEVL